MNFKKEIKMYKKAIIISILLATIPFSLSALCCIAPSMAVVADTGVAIAALERYNAELDNSLSMSKTAVKEAIAIGVEKERILNDLVALKTNAGLRADAKLIIVRELLLKSEASAMSLKLNYGSDVENEIKGMEKK
jgi:hypothetical protein